MLAEALKVPFFLSYCLFLADFAFSHFGYFWSCEPQDQKLLFVKGYVEYIFVLYDDYQQYQE